MQESFAKVAQRWQMVGGWGRRRRMRVGSDQSGARRSAPGDPPAAAVGSFARGSVDDLAATLARSDELMHGLARLSPRQRVTVVLRFYEDMTEAEVAEALGCSVGTVKTQTSRALNHLRGFLDEQARGVKHDAKAETKEMIQ